MFLDTEIEILENDLKVNPSKSKFVNYIKQTTQTTKLSRQPNPYNLLRITLNVDKTLCNILSFTKDFD